MKKLSINTLVFIVLFFISCSSNKEFNNSRNEGSFTLSINQDNTLINKTGTQGVPSLIVPDVNDFSIIINDVNGDKYAGFSKFADMPKQTRLKEGDYTINISHGVNRTATFTSPYYFGSAPFSINGSGNTPVDVTCKISSILVSVSYSDAFKEVFSNYSLQTVVENAKGGHDAISFIGDDSRIAYLRQTDKIFLTMNLTKIKSDKQYKYGVSPIIDAKSGEYYKILFDTNAQGDATITITVSDAVNERNVDVKIGDEYLPKSPPEINGTFDISKSYILRYGMYDNEPLVVVLKADEGIKNIILDIESQYASEHGVPAQIDLKSVSSEHKQAFENIGILWNNDVVGKTSMSLKFTKMISSLPMTMAKVESHNKFKITLIDNYDRQIEQNLDFNILPVNITLQDIEDYNVWFNYVIISPVVISDVPSEEMANYPLSYEFSENGEDWLKSDFVDNEEDYKFENLKSNTAYQVRAVSRGVSSEILSFKTEEKKNVPNASFEEFWEDKYNNEGNYHHCYYPYSKDEVEPFWQSLNPKTTRDRKKEYYKSFPGVRKVTDATDGNYALCIQSVGWGADSSYPWGAWHGAEYITQGRLFVGDFVKSDDNNVGLNSMKKGKPFTSRPKSLSFDYKFSAYNKVIGNHFNVNIELQHRLSDGTIQIIAKGHYEETTKDQKYDFSALTFPGDYSNRTVTLNYTNKKLKATHIFIEFVSDNNSTLGITEIVGTDAGDSSSRWDKLAIGSVIYLDNLNLNY
ncbi:MAG: DUF4493 domain-containing protein [Bacteroidetes bacterium]|nr:DUF4493 domain-containing protein [Bacteroidota bacterium]